MTLKSPRIESSTDIKRMADRVERRLNSFVSDLRTAAREGRLADEIQRRIQAASAPSSPVEAAEELLTLLLPRANAETPPTEKDQPS